MTKIRAAIFAAVSTAAQAKDDKVSIGVQIDRGRELIQDRGWVETAGPYIAIASRTRWIDLKDAALAIPDLYMMITEAQAHLFDVLIIFDYTRLRSLLSPISRTLSAYSIQLLSASQPIEIVDPEKYDPTNADTASIVEFSAGFTSQAEIASLKRRFRQGMPKRIQKKGLHKGQLPYGYRKPIGQEKNREAIPEQHPLQAPNVLLIKELFLAGQSFWQIADQMTERKIISPGGKKIWRDVMVRSILHNKFYSGQVSFGNKRSVTDPLTGKRREIRNPASAIVIGEGRHTPLWDKNTAQLIIEELKRRGQSRYSGKKTARLSNFMYCGTCDARMWVGYADNYSNPEKRVYFCSADRTHIVIKETILVPLFISELTERLKHIDGLVLTPEKNTTHNTTALKELQTRLTRIDDAYEAGAMPLEKYTERSKELLAEIEAFQRQIDDKVQIAARIKQKSEALNGFAQIVKRTPKYLTDAPAQQVNNHLRRIISKLIVSHTKLIIEFSPA